MQEKTEKPLHEIVLDILYFQNTERATEMKPIDVLWKIDNPEISERQIREVLDWLVRQRDVEVYAGKYSLNRAAFLELKQQHQKVDKKHIKNKPKAQKTVEKTEKLKKVVQKAPPKPKETAKTFFQEKQQESVPSQKREPIETTPIHTIQKRKFPFALVFSVLLFVGFIAFFFQYFLEDTSVIQAENQRPEQVLWEHFEPKSLYLSKGEELEDLRKSIENGFYRQNKNNQQIKKTFQQLQKSIEKQEEAFENLLKSQKKQTQEKHQFTQKYFKDITVLFFIGFLLMFFISLYFFLEIRKLKRLE
ncbi:MAG: DUF5457 domain-containing protein [Flavobacteriales bacterium]|jgi:hypothetical protein|nr:DUF5457 domain-containing protein [Flavobacteriales bacterium]